MERNSNIEKYLLLTLITEILFIIALIGCGIIFSKNFNANLIVTAVVIVLFAVFVEVRRKMLKLKRSDIPKLMPTGCEWCICILLFILFLNLQHFLALPAALLSNIPLCVLCLLFALPYYRYLRKLHNGQH